MLQIVFSARSKIVHIQFALLCIASLASLGMGELESIDHTVCKLQFAAMTIEDSSK